MYVKRAAMRAMTASQDQAQAQVQVAAQVIQPQADANQQVQPAEIKDVTMTEASAENAQGEGKKVTSVVGSPLILCREWHSYTAYRSDNGPVGNCCYICPPPWCLGSHRRSEPDSEDSISAPHPLHGNPGRPN